MAKTLPARGTIYRRHFKNDAEYRSVIAVGGNSAATAIADAASATLTFSASQEAGILERLILSANAAVSLVAGADAALCGVVISSFKVANDELIGGGSVPARLFDVQSLWNPPVGKPIDSMDVITVTVTSNTGAGIEITAGCTLA